MEQAVQGGLLAQQIKDLDALIAAMQALQADGATFSGTASVSSPGQGNIILSFPSLTAAESSGLFAGAIATFVARKDALAAQLAAL